MSLVDTTAETTLSPDCASSSSSSSSSPPPPLSLDDQLSRLSLTKVAFDRQLAHLVNQLSSMVTEIASLRTLNEQLYRASVKTIKLQSRRLTLKRTSTVSETDSHHHSEGETVIFSGPAPSLSSPMTAGPLRRLSSGSESSARMSVSSLSSSAAMTSTSSSAMSSAANSRSSSISLEGTVSQDIELHHLTVDEIDELPVLQLNHFINILYETALSSSSNGGVNGKEDFLQNFERLCLEECSSLLRENGLPVREDEGHSADLQTTVHQHNGTVFQFPPDADFEMLDNNEVFLEEGAVAPMLPLEQIEEESDFELTSPSINGGDDSFVTANGGDFDEEEVEGAQSDSSSLVDDIEVTIPESPRVVEQLEVKRNTALVSIKELPSSPTNSSSAVSSASTSPSSDHHHHHQSTEEDNQQDDDAVKDSSKSMLSRSCTTASLSADRPGMLSKLKKRSASFNFHSSSNSSSSSLSVSVRATHSMTNSSESSEDDGKPSSSGDEEMTAAKSPAVDSGRKTVAIRGYDETGKETYERVVLRPVRLIRRSETFASSGSRPTVKVHSTPSMGSDSLGTPSGEEAESMSFANRRNMWERRSLNRGYKFRV